jgi:hypothetical protein
LCGGNGHNAKQDGTTGRQDSLPALDADLYQYLKAGGGHHTIFKEFNMKYIEAHFYASGNRTIITEQGLCFIEKIAGDPPRDMSVKYIEIWHLASGREIDHNDCYILTETYDEIKQQLDKIK